MTKRDYDLIAMCIHASIQVEIHHYMSDDGVKVMHDFARRLASELLNTNPRFDMNRFLVACGVVEKTKA